MTLGDNIIYYRKHREITQEQLAEIMQVSRQSVSKWENNEAVPELQKLIKLADVLEVGLDELCGRAYVSKESEVDYKEISKAKSKIPVKILSIIIIASLLGGIAIGFLVGQGNITTSNVKSFYQDTGIVNVDFKFREPNVVVCTFIPEIYVEEYDYVVLVSDGMHPAYEIDVIFENQVGTANLSVSDAYSYNLTLQVKKEDVVHNINLAEKLSVRLPSGIISWNNK